MGVVMEIMTSSVPGGTCLARVRFQDGQLRCFNNDLDNESCCYYFGVRRYWNPSHGVNAVGRNFFSEVSSMAKRIRTRFALLPWLWFCRHTAGCYALKRTLKKRGRLE
jgi:hypothetical protein